MALHPISVANRAIEEYREHVLTEFRARDGKLRAALEEALNQPRFLAREPFFQAHRPFKDGLAWRELGIDVRLAEVMEKRSESKTAFLHQSGSIRHLLSREAKGLVVTTGTGSGKTECFLLPVIQNAVEDAAAFKRSGLTALLVYPMNALANDQEERIRQYLEASGHGHITVKRYDRSTPEEERAAMRKNPPHVLLTNYMMLEYLLVRPADREALFQNHRCRFVVLDEVHSYRGSLGANIALLVRRLRAHLRHATQDFAAGDREDARRFPRLVPVATSATIKTVEETGKTQAEVRALRDAAVQEFLERLTGTPGADFRVVGEELKDLTIPPDARWADPLAGTALPDPRDPAELQRATAALAGLAGDTPVAVAAARAAILWELGRQLARKPLSVSKIVALLRESVPERARFPEEAVRREVELALVVGAALPDGTPGALRLKTHRLVRGGWRFHRCADPGCGKLYPLGEEHCTCGRLTAPLLLCRTCGADALGFSGEDDPTSAALVPGVPVKEDDGAEWLLYDLDRFDMIEDEEGDLRVRQMKDRDVARGSFDPATLAFAGDPGSYPVRAALAPARTRCLVCGGTAGSRNVVTPVTLGTSAAVRVVSEGLVDGLAAENAKDPDHDGKERLLIFADSRQDAAHQARFITFAGRYDRMRRALVRILMERGPLRLDQAVKALVGRGVTEGDNPHASKKADSDFLPPYLQARAEAWEEAPLLDDLAVTAGYRGTVFNLGLVGVRYAKLDEYVQARGADLKSRLGITPGQILHVARCVLEEMRQRTAVSRPMLQVHPLNAACPDEFKGPADWERRIKTPSGFPLAGGHPVGHLDQSEVVEGVKCVNAWRRQGGAGRFPAIERKVKQLLKRMGGADPTEDDFVALMTFLARGSFVTSAKLRGLKKDSELLQVNADAVVLELLGDADRFRCDTCNVKLPWSTKGASCPVCHGELVPWPAADIQANRYVKRILKPDFRPLVAGEHTAQVTGEDRLELEARFKGTPSESPVNVLACSPTLEMGIDVGGLDAVVLRNVPPRPDNYAQRGGRAGRRKRVGVVVGYTRRTPHDGYFYDRPEEMIAGEVPAPVVGLGNRDVVMRHLTAIALGSAEPGLAGRMAEYVDIQGNLLKEPIDALVAAFEAKVSDAAGLALEAWGPDVLEPAGLGARESLVEALRAQVPRMRDLFARVQHQIKQLDVSIENWRKLGYGDRQAMSAQDLKRRILGMRADGKKQADGAAEDDRSAGNPMRRFAEFGLLPGYEFPSEPATLRLAGDRAEEAPLSVERRFGLAQYRPEATVHARGHRWQVRGLDIASPWNPKSDAPGWVYSVCSNCELHFDSQEHPRCPRCDSTASIDGLPGFEFGGFLATRDDSPVLEEEERIPPRDMVQCHPQWNGQTVARYVLPNAWRLEVRRSEDVRWVNEWLPPTKAERDRGTPSLHGKARGFFVCAGCGRLLTPPEGMIDKKKARKKASKGGNGDDPFGHATTCPAKGQPPKPLALVCNTRATTLRLRVDLPEGMDKDEFKRWSVSLGYALRTGLRHLYMLDGPEIEFEYEPPWDERDATSTRRVGALTFVDAAVGGSGFLDRAAAELHLVAQKAIEHLDHEGCDTACYRCLKSYPNQRFHAFLNWPRIIGDLHELASAAPELRPLEKGDGKDPRPWLEAYAAGVGSPLELKFLRAFEAKGITVAKQFGVPPEAPISTADFAQVEKKVAVYVDGAAFHVGNRLRRDRAIRDRLRAAGWAVLELVAADLANPEPWVSKLA